MTAWDEPRIVMVLPMPEGRYGTISVTVPFIPVCWEHTLDLMADANPPLGVLVQRASQPALRSARPV